MNKKTDAKRDLQYINISRDLSDWMDELKENGLLRDGQDLIRAGVVLGLSRPRSEILEKEEEITSTPEKYTRSSTGATGSKNHRTIDIDNDGHLLLLIKNFSEDKNQSSRRMQTLANLGLEIIKERFFDEIIQWDKVEEELLAQQPG